MLLIMRCPFNNHRIRLFNWLVESMKDKNDLILVSKDIA